MAVENSYDELGRAKGSTYVVDGKTLSYTLSYTTDSSLVDSVTLPKSGSVQSSLGYTYDEFDRLVKKNFSFSTMKNAYEEYDYYSYVKNDVTHTTALVSSLSLVSESGTDTYNYTYDNLGNILTVSKNGAPVESYEYDSLNQLTRENNSSAGYTKLYSYDPMGNITSKVELPFTLAPTASLDTSNGTVTSYGYASGGLFPWGDMLVNYNGTAITYDGIGNPLNWRNASSMEWSARDLRKTTIPNNDTVIYKYNASGIRTQRIYNDVSESTSYTYNYTLDGSKIIKEKIHIVGVGGSATHELYYYYDNTGDVVGFEYNEIPYFYQKNIQGDIIQIVDVSGTVVVEYTYDAWGKLLSTTGTLASTIGAYNPFRYRGYYYDSETGFYYLQSRYYDPIVGRFLNADTFTFADQSILGNNKFAYCGNNPVIRAASSIENGYSEKSILFNKGSFSSIPSYRPSYIMDTVVRYDVPLYYQNGYNLCWAFSQIMIEDYHRGIVSTQAEATEKAIALAKKVHGKGGRDTWDRGGAPTNAYGTITDVDIEFLYDLLVELGPLYGIYYNNDSGEGHCIVITGVNLTKGLVYTNNPWDIAGTQTFEEFLNGFAGMPSQKKMKLLYVSVVIQE